MSYFLNGKPVTREEFCAGARRDSAMQRSPA